MVLSLVLCRWYCHWYCQTWLLCRWYCQLLADSGQVMHKFLEGQIGCIGGQLGYLDGSGKDDYYDEYYENL